MKIKKTKVRVIKVNTKKCPKCDLLFSGLNEDIFCKNCRKEKEIPCTPTIPSLTKENNFLSDELKQKEELIKKLEDNVSYLKGYIDTKEDMYYRIESLFGYPDTWCELNRDICETLSSLRRCIPELSADKTIIDQQNRIRELESKLMRPEVRIRDGITSSDECITKRMEQIVELQKQNLDLSYKNIKLEERLADPRKTIHFFDRLVELCKEKNIYFGISNFLTLNKSNRCFEVSLSDDDHGSLHRGDNLQYAIDFLENHYE